MVLSAFLTERVYYCRCLLSSSSSATSPSDFGKGARTNLFLPILDDTKANYADLDQVHYVVAVKKEGECGRIDKRDTKGSDFGVANEGEVGGGGGEGVELWEVERASG